jgi:Xaa-Pro aminopeptidase
VSAADHAVKRERVLALLDGRADAVFLTSSTAVSWYLEGARVHTSLLGAPVAAVLVDREQDVVRIHSNEVDRLVDEELRGLLGDIVIEAVPWHAPLLPDTGGRARPEESLAAGLRAARAVLLPAERERYRSLCRDAAAAVTRELMRTRPEEAENALAGRLGGALAAIGADPVVVMVAGEGRLAHRHPLPTGAALGRRAMVVVCARRHGLIANLSRWIRFDREDTAAAERTAALQRVEADAFRATRPGATLADVLAEIAAAYPRHGFAKDEWTRHHQGGAAGYAGRDPRATPEARDVVRDGQAFAWNPTAAAAKIEDTILIDGDRVEVLTRDGDWPEVVVDGVPRPVELTL